MPSTVSADAASAGTVVPVPATVDADGAPVVADAVDGLDRVVVVVAVVDVEVVALDAREVVLLHATPANDSAAMRTIDRLRMGCRA
jgi:hypothetical protein